MRQLQQEAFDDGLLDIPYNFVIGDDGFTYEGRGFRYQGEIPNNSSANTFEDIGLIIAFIGSFNETQPSPGQLETFERFLESAVNLNVVTKDFIILMQDEIVYKKNTAHGLHKAISVISELAQHFYSSKRSPDRGSNNHILQYFQYNLSREEIYGMMSRQ